MTDLVLATQNAHKLSEVQAILESLAPGTFHLILPRDLGYTGDVEETGKTFEENAYLKADALFAATGISTIADDSGLCVDALSGAPGIYSARFSGKHGNDALNRKVLLEKLADQNDRIARFVCALACVTPARRFCVKGEVLGEILYAERGSNGFGYDSLFYYPPKQKSFAELPAEEKNRLSHRYQALKAFAEAWKGTK